MFPKHTVAFLEFISNLGQQFDLTFHFHIFFFFVQAKELVQQKGPEARNKMQDQNRGPELIRHKARCPDSAASRKAA